MNKQTRGNLAEWFMIALCTLTLVFFILLFALSFAAKDLIGSRDFTVYWATGKLLVQHSNPYDPHLLGIIERNAGLHPPEEAMFMRNPPWCLPITWPLGLLPFYPASLLWGTCLFACFLLSLYLLRNLYGNGHSKRYLCGFLFAPALICMIAGQTSLFLLLGLTLFLRNSRSHPFWAGSALLLCTFKPHVFIPFALTLLLWVLVRKQFKIIFGFLASFAFFAALTTLMDPRAWSEYMQLLHSSGQGWNNIPCIGFYFRTCIPPHALWMQYVPTLLGCAWSLHFFWKRRNTWNWQQDAHLPVLISLLVAPYTWIFDQSIALPAMIYAAYKAPDRRVALQLPTINALLSVETFCFRSKLIFAATLWTIPAWIAWYLIVMHLHQKNASNPVPLSSEQSETA